MRIERGAEAVDEGHRPEARRGTGTRTVRPQGLLHRAQEQAQRRALQIRVTVTVAAADRIVDARTEGEQGTPAMRAAEAAKHVEASKAVPKTLPDADL